MLQIYNLLIKGILESVDRIVNTVGGGYYYFFDGYYHNVASVF